MTPRSTRRASSALSCTTTIPRSANPTRFRGRTIPNHTLNGVPEWACGATEWLELGTYIPLDTLTGSGHFQLDGAKLQAEFVVPNAQERSFFFGIDFELS